MRFSFALFCLILIGSFFPGLLKGEDEPPTPDELYQEIETQVALPCIEAFQEAGVKVDEEEIRESLKKQAEGISNLQWSNVAKKPAKVRNAVYVLMLEDCKDTAKREAKRLQQQEKHPESGPTSSDIQG